MEYLKQYPCNWEGELDTFTQNTYRFGHDLLDQAAAALEDCDEGVFDLVIQIQL
jgi:hypothetical protein